MPARKRPASGATKSPQQRAIAIAIKNRMKYPYATYGRAYMQRGTEDNIAMFGPTFKEATAEQRAKRRALGYTGRGGYWGRKLGTWVGRRTGIPGVGSLAGLAGSKLEDYARKRLSGRGLYVGRGSYNNLIEGGDMSMSGMGDETEAVIFTNREYIKDVYGPVDGSFTNMSLNLNPGLEEVFPWLAQVAANYEEYEFIQLLFEFKSTVNPSTAGDGQTGTVIMATNYNASEKAFTDKASMMQYHGGQSGRLTEDLVHGVECAPGKSVGDMHKYIRTDPVSDDIKSYDHGKFNFAIANMPSEFANQQVGELWVSYKIKLLKPKLGCARLVNQSVDRFFWSVNSSAMTSVSASGSVTLTAGVEGSTKRLFEHTSNNIGCLYEFNAGKLIFPATLTGVFEVVLRVRADLDENDAGQQIDPSNLAITSTLAGDVTRRKQIIMPSEQSYNHDSYRTADPIILGESMHSEKALASNSTVLHLHYVAIVMVKAAHDGVDNTISFNFKNNTSATVKYGFNSAVLEIKEVKDLEENLTWNVGVVV